MDLVPVYEDELVGGVAVTVDPVIQQNMGLRTAIVGQEPLERTIRTYGHVTADETRTIQVNLKTGGWIEKLYVDYTGMYVEKGQPLFEFYSPDLLAAQEEYLSTLKSIGSRLGDSGSDLLQSARRRLEYFDVAVGEIQSIQDSGKVKKNLVIRSPFTGYVIDRNVEEGSYVKAGTTIFRITDLSHVWVEAHVYEYEFPWIREGLAAEMTLPYEPGRVFPGRVSFVYPYLQPKTRDVVIRLQFVNPDMKLKPDMYADVRIRTATEGMGMVIPTEAVIRSGERNLVFVTRDNNKFTPRDVTLGPALDDGKVQILSGLAPGEVIVTSGQFLLDSESKLKEAVQKMLEAKRAEVKTGAAKTPETEELFEDPEPEEDFFEDMEEGDDFFKDLEE
jgi:multidrug efflux pump subunit AcrA (membrane-fusion protein)